MIRRVGRTRLIKGNPVKIRDSTRYCEAREEGKHSAMPLSEKDGKVAFRVSQETCQAKERGYLPGQEMNQGKKVIIDLMNVTEIKQGFVSKGLECILKCS